MEYIPQNFLCRVCDRRCHDGTNLVPGVMDHFRFLVLGNSWSQWIKQEERRKHGKIIPAKLCSKKRFQDMTTPSFGQMLGAWDQEERTQLFAGWVVTTWTRNKVNTASACPWAQLSCQGEGMGRSSWRIFPLPHYFPLWCDGHSFSYQTFGTTMSFCLVLQTCTPNLCSSEDMWEPGRASLRHGNPEWSSSPAHSKMFSDNNVLIKDLSLKYYH